VRRTIAVIVAMAGTVSLGVSAAQGALPLTLSTSTLPLAALSTSSASSSSASSAGKPVPTDALFCGLWAQGSDRIAGNSNIDHPSGAEAMGQVYDYTGQTCEDEYNSGNFQNGSDMFTWTISHSNVNTKTERGTEHGLFTLDSSSPLAAGFNGQVTNYDFTTPITPGETPDSNGNRQISYASGHAYDPSGSGSGAGNFNTHGGAATGEHFRGKYGTIVYQDQNNQNSPCQSGSQNYCFEGILQGQTN
jgi:hypothetical protein